MKTKPVIPPSIGRRVLLFVATVQNGAATGVLGTPTANRATVPFDAGVAYVHGDDAPDMNRINVGYTDHNGVQHALTSVALYDRPQQDHDAHGKENYAVWMPYQFQQALRALEAAGLWINRPGFKP